jgi:hypothetical protein
MVPEFLTTIAKVYYYGVGKIIFLSIWGDLLDLFGVSAGLYFNPWAGMDAVSRQ